MTKEEKQAMVPVWEKALLTVEEAAAYTNVGTHKLREISEDYDCKFVLWVGNKRLFKREKLLEYLEHTFSV